MPNRSEVVETPWKCLDAACERVWSVWQLPPLRPQTNCPFCGSSEIEEVQEEGE